MPIRRLAQLTLAALLLVLVVPPGPAPVAAQGLFERLFGPRYAPPPQDRYYRYQPYYGQPPPGYLPPPSQNDRPAPRGPSEPPLPKVTVVPKDADAKVVLVIGDFLASALADGLTFTFGDDPKLTVLDRNNAGSGFVRNDYYDWEKQLPDILNKVNPAYVVLLIGTNDRQPLRTGPTTREALRSEPWEAAYRKRIDGVLQTLKVYGRPYLWVGLPPMASPSSSADMAYFNGIYKAQVEAVGGKFVDVWNGFADENGKFTMRAPDADGQVRTMRQGDGINLTRAGSIKLAYYVDREIRKKGGVATETLATSTSSDEKIELGPRGERWLVGPVISLVDPPPGSDGKLAGAGPAAMPSEGSAQYKVVVEGASLAPVAGRADDISWPPMKPDLAPVAVAAPAATTTTTATRPATTTTTTTPPVANRTTGTGTPAAGGQRTGNAGGQGGAAASNQGRTGTGQGAPATGGQGGGNANARQNNPPQTNSGAATGPVPPAPIPNR